MKQKPTTKNELSDADNVRTHISPVAILPPVLDFTCADTATHLPQAEFPPTKLLLTVKDCAAMTALSEKTILRLLQRGKLRCLSSIRHKRIPASELARFIRENLS
jgi:excisionase family DNA binding protein